MSQKPSFRGPLDRKHGKWVETLSLLVIHKILRLFVNTLTVDDKHYLLTRDNLTQAIQIQLSEKQNTFCEFFFESLKSILNFKHLSKKEDPHSWCISENTSSKKYGAINVWKALFQKILRKTTRQLGRNTVRIWMAAPLQYLLIPLKILGMEKVSFSDIQNLKAVC